MLTPSNIRFDRSKQQYFYHPSDRLVSDYQLRKIHYKAILATSQWSDRLVDSLQSKDITFSDFQLQVATQLKNLKVASLELSKGGKSNTFALDYLGQANQLRQIDYPALKKLFLEIKEGKHSAKMVKSRLRNFWKSSRQAFESGIKSRAELRGHDFAIRILAIADHCEDCVTFAKLGIQPIYRLPLPTEQCRCSFNCRCSYYTGSYKSLSDRFHG